MSESEHKGPDLKISERFSRPKTWRDKYTSAGNALKEGIILARQHKPESQAKFLEAGSLQVEILGLVPVTDTNLRVMFTLGAANCFLMGKDASRARELVKDARNQMNSSTIDFEYGNKQADRILAEAEKLLPQQKSA